MLLNDPTRLLGLAALLCTAVPVFASEPIPKADFATCTKPDYPPRARKAGEEGISVIGFLVRPDGTAAKSIVLSSSGSRDLDRAAADAVSRCRFSRAAGAAAAHDLWTRVTYSWRFEDDPDMLRAKQTAARAAGKGDLNALYHLSLVLAQTASTDAGREQALVVLLSAAEQGHAQAQFELGQRYEKGKWIEANPGEARRWYEKSAAQDHPLAVQRLALGIMPD